MTPTDLLVPELTEAARPEVEDAVIEEARRRARRRRRRYGAVVGVLALVGAAVFATFDRTSPAQNSATAGATRVVVPGVEAFRGVAWCVPDPSGREDPVGGEEFVVGAGAPVRTWCSFTPMADGPAYCPGPCSSWLGARANHLFQIGGSTILMRLSGTYRVADGRLTRLGGADALGMSHNGRYLATTSGQCAEVRLLVHEVATATEVARTEVPVGAASCAGIAGIDNAGRVYVTVGPENRGDAKVLMYDTGTDLWTRVSGIPTLDGRLPTITYITETGFAVARQEGWFADGGYSVPVASVEGRIDSLGRFSPQRPVPVGQGAWSPDRSYVAEGRAAGDVVVRDAAHLTHAVVLELPQNQGGPGANIQWESPTSVVVTSFNGKEDRPFWCDVRSGDCQRLDRDGWMALGENAGYGG